jgi:hypothetical protein
MLSDGFDATTTSWGYGSLLSQGRRKKIQIFKQQQPRLRDLAACFLREVCSLVRLPLKRGRGEYRALDAPAASYAK